MRDNITIVDDLKVGETYEMAYMGNKNFAFNVRLTKKSQAFIAKRPAIGDPKVLAKMESQRQQIVWVYQIDRDRRDRFEVVACRSENPTRDTYIYNDFHQVKFYPIEESNE